MQTWRQAIACAMVMQIATAAFAEDELLPATDAPAALPAYEDIGVGHVMDGFPSASWAPTEAAGVAADDTVGAPAPARGSWFGGVELVRLEPRYSYMSSITYFGSGAISVLEEGPTLYAPRAFIGWQSAGGIAARGRLMALDEPWGIQPPDPRALGPTIRATRLDFDLYRQFVLHSGSVSLGGSLASADVDLRVFAPEQPHVKAFGLGVFAEGRHEFYKSTAWEGAIVGRARWAPLFGKTEYSVLAYNVPGQFNRPVFLQEIRATRDAEFHIIEAAIGIECVRKFLYADLALQTALESQNWRMGATSELALFGSSFSVSLRR